MNVALITAGGVGMRMNNPTPKQFLIVDDKPIIIYTLEAFQNHSDIDMIVVPCLAGWEDILKQYAILYGIDKLKCIVTGGNTGQESIAKGLKALKDVCNDNDIILVHDGDRPLISERVISDAIEVCRTKGNAVTQVPCTTVMVSTDNQTTAKKLLDRDYIKGTQTPQAFSYKDILNGYEKMEKEEKNNVTAPVSVMMECGETINFAKGDPLNFKLTTLEDLIMFEAIVQYNKNKELTKSRQKTIGGYNAK